jgi:hypothetical protein
MWGNLIIVDFCSCILFLLLKKDMELVVNIDQMVVIQPNSCGAIQTIELEKHKSRL